TAPAARRRSTSSGIRSRSSESSAPCRRPRRSTTTSSFRYDSDEGDMPAEARRRHLLTAMADAGIEHMVLYGNAWQGDYLRYAADFGILEGHGIAIVAADGKMELFLDSAVEAERAEAEAPDIAVAFAPDIARAVGARLERVANHRLGRAPRRFLPKCLADPERSSALEDGTPLGD